MRTPRPRYNHSMVYWTKRTWLLFARNRKVNDFSKPPNMPAGAKIHDAVQFVKEPKEKVVFPKPYTKEPIYLENEGNPDWNVKILHYTQDTKLIEGCSQSLVLSKTLMYPGLAKPVHDLVGKIQLKNADELLQRKLISEYFWDSTQEKLPKRVDPEQPWRIFKRDFGVTLERKVRGLENQIWNLCSMAIGPASCQRHRLVRPYVKTFFEREGQRILSEVVGDAAILGSQPLPLLDPNPVATQEQRLEEIYPLSPLVDLESINIYKEGHTFCVNPTSPKRFCHLLFLGDCYEKKWLDKQILAKGILACFSFATSQAHSFFGPQIKKLPVPISVNCMLFQEQKITFFSYQLNTLDLDAPNGVRNQVWIDGPNQIFEEFNGTNELIGYEPSVFSKALALTSHGLNL